jgi:alcohol dehydrogenase class IV
VISYLSNIHFDVGASSQLADVLDAHDIDHPLVVTDQGIVDAGLLEPLGLQDAIRYDAVQTNPTEASVLAGAECYRDALCDGIVAVGGGSPIDCAKAIALIIAHDPPLSDYAFVNGGLDRITDDQPPVIAVPTTAGTGSEVGRAALIVFNDGRKLGLLSPHLIPDAVICDPNLTLGLPPVLTAATGMDAITHCVETFCSPRFNPIADAIALDGLRRACGAIERAVVDGSDLDARSEMMMAALEGGMTFQKGLGAIHSLSHPLGALPGKRLHHGMLNAIFLPHVLRFNRVACADRMARLAQTAGAPDGDALADHFAQLIKRIGLPTCLGDLDLTGEDLAPLAIAACEDHCTATNPRHLGVDDCAAIYLQAL